MDQGNIDARLDAITSTEEVKPVEQKESMPDSKQEQTAPAEVKKAEEHSDEEEALANSKNPERTKAYIEKLKKQIEDSKPKEAPQNYGESIFDSFKPQPTTPSPTPQPQERKAPLVDVPYLNPLQKENLTQQFVDASGNVDIDGLNKALISANQAAYQANQRAQSTEQKVARMEETQQIREAHALVPEIDPQSKSFDPQLFEATRDRLARRWMEGKTPRLVDVALEIKQSLFREPTVDTAAIKQETQKARNQGPFESGAGERQPDTTLNDLRKQTRAGGERGDKALEESLKALGI